MNESPPIPQRGAPAACDRAQPRRMPARAAGAAGAGPLHRTHPSETARSESNAPPADGSPAAPGRGSAVHSAGPMFGRRGTQNWTIAGWINDVIADFSTTGMKTENSRRWMMVGLYAVAMAWVESAVVNYLRTLVNRIDPYQPNPLPISTGLGNAELVRELATLVMLYSVGWLAGSTSRTRLGYAAFAFGVWDILYYVFLRVMTGWPRSLSDWDILFLIPLPWWGPVWAPVSIALLMILWGTLTTQCGQREPFPTTGWKSAASGAAGAALALLVFMADAIRIAGQGSSALRTMLPARFHWQGFAVALALMAIPVLEVAWQGLRARRDAEPQRQP